jgi:hypothetical protein
MNSPRFEAFLALLYTDGQARLRFEADPQGEAARAGLDAQQVAALAAMDFTGLGFAARSFDKKRAKKRAVS